MGILTINGQQYVGNNIEIRGTKVIIDGKEQPQVVSGVVEVRVTQGVLNHLTTDASVRCGNVEGDVVAGGSVNCDSVGGSVSASGSINCDDIGGNATAGGSIRRG